MAEKILEVKNVSMQFGGLRAVDRLSFAIEKGQLAGLIGPNGAGKTTLFNLLTGVYAPTEGEIFFDQAAIVDLKPYQIARRGLSRTFQNIRLFKDLSVLDNVLVASSFHSESGFLSAIVQTKKFLNERTAQKKKALELLSIFGLSEWSMHTAGALPYGLQRQLEIVRALATDPKMICLDEPAAGLNHQETDQLMNLIAKIRKEFNLTILLIEHDMKLVMGICENIFVLDHGCKIEEGPAQVIQNSKAVIEAYLGVDTNDA